MAPASLCVLLTRPTGSAGDAAGFVLCQIRSLTRKARPGAVVIRRFGLHPNGAA